MSRVLTSILINSFRIKLFRFFFFLWIFHTQSKPFKMFPSSTIIQIANEQEELPTISDRFDDIIVSSSIGCYMYR